MVECSYLTIVCDIVLPVLSDELEKLKMKQSLATARVERNDMSNFLQVFCGVDFWKVFNSRELLVYVVRVLSWLLAHF